MSEPTVTAAVFLSYAREDTDAARRIADALRGFGVEVWFDQNELRGGDTWDQKIRGQIRTCTLFMAVISANTQERTEGYFRREWKIAVERTHDMADGVPFIVPVVIDATAESAALVPEQFMKVQWTRLAGGMPTPEFVAQTKRLLAPRRATAGAVPPVSSANSTSAPSSKTPLLAVAAVAVIAVGAAVFFALRPPAKDKTSATEPAKPVAETKATPAPAPAPAPAAPQKISDKSIAVLPLANMSEDKDTGFFADGVHEDLLTNLALVSELKVVSRTTAMQYRGSSKSMKQIGEELGVAYILEGSVRRSGNKVRVTGQLINARTDEHVWAKSYDKDLTDIFAIQSSLAQEIASALQAAITPQAQKFINRRPTENPVAYDAYVKGRTLRNLNASQNLAPLKQAEALFQSAVDQDPNFGDAWGELAVAHALQAFWGNDQTTARLARADAAMANAVRLAPDLPNVIRATGSYAFYAHRDYAHAIAEYEKLARLQPNDPTVFSLIALVQVRQGKWAESVASLRKAAELDPGDVSIWRYLRQSFLSGRRWEDAIAAQRRCVALLPDRIVDQVVLAELSYSATGSRAEMNELLKRATPTELNSPFILDWRKTQAATADYAEFKRLDALQPFYDGDAARFDHSVQAIDAAFVYAAHNDLTAARTRLADYPAELRARLEREPANARVHINLGRAEVLLGHHDEAVRLAQKAMELLPDSLDAREGWGIAVSAAGIFAWAGEKDRAFAQLTRLLRTAGGGTTDTPTVHRLRDDPKFAPLRSDPRWETFLADPKNNAPLF